MSMRRVLYTLAAIELTAAVIVGTNLLDVVSGLGLPEIAALLSALLGLDDPSWLNTLLFP